MNEHKQQEHCHTNPNLRCMRYCAKRATEQRNVHTTTYILGNEFICVLNK